MAKKRNNWKFATFILLGVVILSTAGSIYYMMSTTYELNVLKVKQCETELNDIVCVNGPCMPNPKSYIADCAGLSEEKVVEIGCKENIESLQGWCPAEAH